MTRFCSALLIPCILTAAASADAILINSGGPVTFSTFVEEDIYVRDQGCAQSGVCANPGPPTTATFIDGGNNNNSYSVFVLDSSTAIFSTGSIYSNVVVRDHARLELIGNSFGGPVVSISDFATLLMDGGDAEDDLYVGGDAFGQIFSGDVGRSIRVQQRGLLEIHGGVVCCGPTGFDQNLFVTGEGVVKIFGSRFEIDGVPVGYGPVAAESGTLTGTLASGENGYFVFGNEFAITGTILLVPEPSTALLLAGGLLGLAVRRRSN